uniref:Uncharacterized protein n=1 Tax=Poecilia mexicana TaxID=48701 RepID=A0A3B3XND7_9TELE
KSCLFSLGPLFLFLKWGKSGSTCEKDTNVETEKVQRNNQDFFLHYRRCCSLITGSAGRGVCSTRCSWRVAAGYNRSGRWTGRSLLCFLCAN